MKFYITILFLSFSTPLLAMNNKDKKWHLSRHLLLDPAMGFLNFTATLHYGIIKYSNSQ